MKRAFVFIVSVFACFIISSCTTIPIELLPPTVISNDSISNYNYVYIKPTKEITYSKSSASGGYYANLGYGSYDESVVTDSIVPSEWIAGCFMNYGFVVLDSIDDSLLDKTLVVSFGQSGQRIISSFAYTNEIILQLLSAKDKSLIFSVKAEGCGRNDVDDVRIAITRAVDALFGESQEPKAPENSNF